MKQSDVSIYHDSDDFELLDNIKYPCSTQYMVYNALLHRYQLTPEGLIHYGIDAQRRYISDNPNKLEELCKLVSKKVYDTIQYKAGFSRYQVMMYRIATAPTVIYPDQYFMRKQFEGCLADQARYLIDNGDRAKYSGVNVELDAQAQVVAVRPEDAMRDLSDISPETLRTLDSLNLTRWFSMANANSRPDITKY